MVENDEEVQADVDYVDYQTAVIELCQCTEKYDNIDKFIDPLHGEDEAEHDCESQVHEPHNHQRISQGLVSWRSLYRLAHVGTASQS